MVGTIGSIAGCDRGCAVVRCMKACGGLNDGDFIFLHKKIDTAGQLAGYIAGTFNNCREVKSRFCRKPVMFGILHMGIHF